MSLMQRVSGAIAVLRGAPFEIQTAKNMQSDDEATSDDKTQKSRKTKKRAKAIMTVTLMWTRQNLMLALTIAAVLFGCVFGFIGRQARFSSQTILLISFPGEILMRLLKMFILPLITSSLIAGMAQLDTKSSGKIGIRALTYYMVTTVIAAILGIIVVVVIHPGDPSIKNIVVAAQSDEAKVTTLDAVLDIMRNLVPENLIQACFQQVQTTYVRKKIPLIGEEPTKSAFILEPTIIYRDGTNVMGMILFCVTFGLMASHLGFRARPIVDFFVSLNEIIMEMVRYIVTWFAPLGIMCLIAGNIMSIVNLMATVRMLGLYMFTVTLGLSIHGIITLPLIYWLITKQNPALFFKGIMQAWITAMGTASCAATLPITFQCLEQNNKIDARVTRFVTSVGATINMDGTALYEAVAAIFIAQLNGISLGVGEIITVSLTATLASIGAASIPSAALITMVLVLTSLGLPTNDISLLFTVDWFLDRIRTSVNVLGDSYGAGIVYHLSKDELNELDRLKDGLKSVVIERDDSCIKVNEDVENIDVTEFTSETKI